MQIALVEPTRGLVWYEGFTEKSSQVGNMLVERVHTG